MQKLNKDRAENRLATLNAAMEKCTNLVAENPGSLKVPAWQARIAEYQQSIENIKTYRMESITDAERAELEAAQ